MNSHALVKVETGRSRLERALGARGARLLLATGGTAAVVLSIPTPLIEQIATSSGLNEISRLFEPPIGLGTRILLAGGLALVPAAIVWALWAPRHPAVSRGPAWAERDEDDHDYDYGSGPAVDPVQVSEQDNSDNDGDADEMMQARKQSSGWGAIIRLVRGGFNDNAEGRDGMLPKLRRRDRHPDAPPRPPLSASRDLPPHEGRSGAQRLTEAEAPRAFSDAVAFIQPQRAAAVAPPPRSPEPMSDEDIARVLGAMPRSPAPLSAEEVSRVIDAIPANKPATTAPAPAVASPPGRDASLLSRKIDLPLIEGADLAALAARFEQGLGKREAIVHAEEARHSLDSRIAFAQPDPSVRAALRAQRPLEVVPASATPAAPTVDVRTAEPTLHLDVTVEQALNSALATLRKLTEQGRR
ncbi:hypothetical protein [Sphingobium nicotianae]|uniref:Uncharacterized protein n=1 Tax=Sphingobium nicotianae TaxID=2782607 RepID=A0A9X1DF80_9SPHN|nr:hypothetical protein [Sphingobium nicotianae]MBT2188827.1 hypothetical protein [Sphingobium nicotianae]